MEDITFDDLIPTGGRKPSTPGADLTFDDLIPSQNRQETGSPKSPISSRPSGRHLTFEDGLVEMEKERQDSRWGQAGAVMSSALEDVPLIGPALIGSAQKGAAALGSAIDGDSYEANLRQAQNTTRAAQESNPVSSIAGTVAGNIAALAPVGATATGARALGITGRNLLSRAVKSGVSSALISGADTAVRGGDTEELAGNTAISGLAGAAIPVVGAGFSAGIRGINNRLYPTIRALTDPVDEAARRVGSAVTRDAAFDPDSVLSATDEVVAAKAGIPLMNVDRGGETTRALARSVANQSPEARGLIDKAASDRFAAQSQRAAEFMKRIVGGNADDLALQERVRMTARIMNRSAYKAANESPEAQQVFTRGIQELMQSPSFRQAVSAVPKRSADRAAVEGFKEIRNPFTVNSRGDFVLKRDATGKLIAPNLEFWNQTEINLDGAIGKARRAGDDALASDLLGLKNKLVDELDRVVPAYKTARQGAFAAFQAEDAIEAGKKFANSPRLAPEARRLIERLPKTDRENFAIGYASEKIDKIKASGDRTNIINSMFKSQAAREMDELVFGPEKARQLEAFIRVEDAVDRIRGALGGSTTARQLQELGISGGIGGGAGLLIGGDFDSTWKGAALGGALSATRGGWRYVGEKANAKAMEEIGRLLVQDNPMALRSAVSRAARNPAMMEALEKLSEVLAIPTRAMAVSGGQ